MNSMKKVLSINIFLLVICSYSVQGQILNKPEESPCEWKGAQGTCVNPRRCRTFKSLIVSHDRPPICSFQGNTSIICCVDCDILKANDSIKDIVDRFKVDWKYQRKCLEYYYLLPYPSSYFVDDAWVSFISYELNEEKKCFQKKISAGGVGGGVGGVNAQWDEFPHMALIGYGPDLESAQWLCGGSLISERFILTAGHCASSTQLGDASYVALGMLKRSDPPRYWKRYKIKRFIRHPDYLPPSKYNDIALIETQIFMNLTDGVRPACLTHKPEFRGDDEAYATGWGALGNKKENADVMQKMVLQKFSAEECAAQYPPHRHMLRGYNHTTQVCYGDRNVARDTCERDSGGPLQKIDLDEVYKMYAIIGVTSSGHPCRTPGIAGLYTRVSHYVSWIESVVWP